MQELVSLLSIIVGVIVLTAWAMWLWIRPNGDSKTLDLGDQLSRDGMTRTVMANNELKNKIKQLELELKVLSNSGKVEKQQEATKAKPAAKVESKPESKTIKESKAEPKTEFKTEPKAEPKAEPEKSKDKRRVAKDERKKAEKEKKKSRENLLKIKELKAQIRDNEVKSKLKSKAQLAAQESNLEKENSKAITKNEDKATRITKTGANVVPLSEGQRIVADAEKKKIADYLASVAETTERHKKEVEAIDEQDKMQEVASKYPENDLKKIKGIGPHLEGKLKKSGIISYQQIANLSEDEIKQISEIIGSYPRRIRREKMD